MSLHSVYSLPSVPIARIFCTLCNHYTVCTYCVYSEHVLTAQYNMYSLYVCNPITGYMSVWTKLGEYIEATDSQRRRESYSYPGSSTPATADLPPTVVCIGGEWYTFPTHFFLPKNSRLEYIRGNFHGQLPQHFPALHGTSGPPLQNFNDRNAEEQSRYVNLTSCDYLVASMDGRSDKTTSNKPIKTRVNADYSWRSRISNFIDSKIEEEEVGGNVVDSYFQFTGEVRPDVAAEEVRFRLLFDRKVIDPAGSSSAVARAYFLPGISQLKNSYKYYSALKLDAA